MRNKCDIYQKTSFYVIIYMHLLNFIFCELFTTLVYNNVIFNNIISFEEIIQTKMVLLYQYTEYKLSTF